MLLKYICLNITILIRIAYGLVLRCIFSGHLKPSCKKKTYQLVHNRGTMQMEGENTKLFPRGTSIHHLFVPNMILNALVN
jgi:hypothetical protein